MVYVHPKVTSSLNDTNDPLRALGINWEKLVEALEKYALLAPTLVPAVLTAIAALEQGDWGPFQQLWTTYAPEMVADVLTILVAAGQNVVPGDTLVMLESMKMEIPVFAEAPGVVADVSVTAGDVVQEGDVLVTVES
mgnify:CR=1 FL=1